MKIKRNYVVVTLVRYLVGFIIAGFVAQGNYAEAVIVMAGLVISHVVNDGLAEQLGYGIHVGSYAIGNAVFMACMGYAIADNHEPLTPVLLGCLAACIACFVGLYVTVRHHNTQRSQ